MTLIVMEKCLENKIILQTGLLVRRSCGTSTFCWLYELVKKKRIEKLMHFILVFLVYFRLYLDRGAAVCGIESCDDVIWVSRAKRMCMCVCVHEPEL